MKFVCLFAGCLTALSAKCDYIVISVQLSSVTPGLTWCRVQALQDHNTVISVIYAVVGGTEMSSGVARIRTEMLQR